MSLEIVVVLVLILTNGFFALSEMAVMTARKSRLRQEAKESHRAQVALELAEKPERFLSSIQVWITLLGILTGFFGGESIAARLEVLLIGYAWFGEYAHVISVTFSLGIILFVSVVVGELVPKRLAIIHAERLAARVAIPMRFMANVAKPVVVALSASTEFLLRLLRMERGSEQAVTQEEIKHLLEEGAEQGVIDLHERNMVNRVLTLGDRSIAAVMTPRTDIAWLDATESFDENLHIMRETAYANYPVKKGTEQDIAGIFQIKRLVGAMAASNADLFKELTPVLYVPETAQVFHVLEKFRDDEAPLALVVDEYGEIQGMVTPNDILVAVFGRLAQGSEESDAALVRREDGSWLADGKLNIDDLKESLDIAQLPYEKEQDFRTIAGMVNAHYGRIPHVGEHFTLGGFRFEVVDLDGARVDKVLIEAVGKEQQKSDAES